MLPPDLMQHLNVQQNILSYSASEVAWVVLLDNLHKAKVGRWENCNSVFFLQ